MAVYTFKHAFIGKAKQAAGTAAAHVRYITRKSATHAIASQGMPRHPHAVQRFMDERESSIRKNGRVCDKFIIAVPREMNQAQALHTLRRFGNRISTRWDSEQGRVLKGAYFLTLQDWDRPNPHCHFVLVDADRETGERVFGTTRKGSTERLRAAWEDVCNGELERLGIEARIDRRPQHVIEAELQASDEIGQLHPDAPITDLPSPAEAVHQSPALPEGDMAARDEKLELIHDELQDDNGQPGIIQGGIRPVSVVARVRGAHQLTKRLEELRSERAALTTALRWREAYEEQSRKAAATGQRMETAEASFQRNLTHGYVNGRPQLVGVQLPSWSILPKAVRGWQSKARKEAVAARDKLEDVKNERAADERNADHARRVMEQQERATAPIAAKVEGYAWMPPEQKREALQNMAQAETVIQATRAAELEPVTDTALYEAFAAGEVTAEEAMEVCQVKGFDDCAEQIRHIMEQTKEQEEGQER